jgi:hypothetical protein
MSTNKNSDELSKPWFILSNIVPPIGFFLYFKHKKQFPNKAKKALIGAIIGIPVGLVMKHLTETYIFN